MGEENNEENQNIEFLNVTGRGRLVHGLGLATTIPVRSQLVTIPLKYQQMGKSQYQKMSIRRDQE